MLKRASVPIPGTQAERTGKGGLLPSLLAYVPSGKAPRHRFVARCRELGLEHEQAGDAHTDGLLCYRVWGIPEALESLYLGPECIRTELWTLAGRTTSREDGSIRGQRMGRAKRSTALRGKADLPYALDATIDQCSGHLMRERSLRDDDDSLPCPTEFTEQEMPYTSRMGQSFPTVYPGEYI